MSQGIELFPGLDNIILGDVLEVLPRIPGECVHLIITSPPYNLEKNYEHHSDDLEDREYLGWMRRVWEACERVLVPGGRICINIGENKRQYITNPTYSAFIQQLVEMRMLYRGTIIWNKHSAAKHCAWGSWQSPSNPHIVPRHEYIIVFSKGQWKLEGPKDGIDITDEEFMACTRSVWSFGTESKKRIGHPAPFPEKLPERLIKFYTYRGTAGRRCWTHLRVAGRLEWSRRGWGAISSWPTTHPRIANSRASGSWANTACSSRRG